MKHSISVLTTALAIFAITALSAISAEPRPPGQVDFGTFSPPSGGGEFVEINVSSTLIALAVSLVEKAEPEVAKVLRGLQSVKVSVVGLDDQNRGDITKRAARIRKELDNKGWERIVTAQKQDQDVGIYLKSQENKVQGLTLVVVESQKQQAVFINVVGEIRPEQLSMIGERLHIEHLKKAGKATEPQS